MRRFLGEVALDFVDYAMTDIVRGWFVSLALFLALLIPHIPLTWSGRAVVAVGIYVWFRAVGLIPAPDVAERVR